MVSRLLAGILVPILAVLLPAPASGQTKPQPFCASPSQITVLAAGPADGLLAGTQTGRLYYRAAGNHCFAQLAAPPLRGQAVGVLLVPPGHPSWIIAGPDLLMLAGGAESVSQAHGLYRSEDGGHTWSDSTSGLHPRNMLALQLAASPNGPLVLAYTCPPVAPGSGEPSACNSGLARSTDGGRSWRQTGPRGMAALGVTTVGAGTFLAVLSTSLSNQRTGQVFSSGRDGRAWRHLGNLPEDATNLTALSGPSWDPSLVLAGFGKDTLIPGVLRSITGGAQWASPAWKVPTTEIGLVVSFTADPRTRTLFLADVSSIYRSQDGGATWTPATRGLPIGAAGFVANALLADKNGRTVYAGNLNPSLPGLYVSDTDGTTWKVDS